VNIGDKNEIRVGKKRGIMGKYFHSTVIGREVKMIVP
jgi:hypothetical protein